MDEQPPPPTNESLAVEQLLYLALKRPDIYNDIRTLIQMLYNDLRREEQRKPSRR